MNPEALKLLRCVETQQPLALMADAALEQLNEAIAAARVVNRAGETLDRPLTGALINQEQSLCYPIFDGIPVLIGDEAVELGALDLTGP